MKKNLSIIFAFIAISFLFSTCKKDDDSSPAINDTPAGDSIALLDIYRIASRDPSRGLSNWNLSLPMDQWGEVTLNENRRVLSFSNHSVDINGQIPLSVKNLTKLKSLGITVNKETPFPSHIFSLTNLLYLDLTGFVGAIPKELGNFANLTSLTLQGAHTGSVPKELGNLTNLESLVILGTSWYGGDVPAGQFLTGSIPKELGSLTNLRSLSIVGGVTGSIPKELANLTQLRLLYLMSNQLSGTIPEEFANLTQLGSLYLSHNQLSGAIPQALLDRFGDQPNVFCPQVGTNFDNYDCNLAP